MDNTFSKDGSVEAKDVSMKKQDIFGILRSVLKVYVIKCGKVFLNG